MAEIFEPGEGMRVASWNIALRVFSVFVDADRVILVDCNDSPL